MKRVQLSYLFFVFTTTVGFAQCPEVSFDSPSSLCLEESLFLENIQNYTTDYTWDFCSGDILNEATGEALVTLSDLSNLRGIVTDYEEANGLIGFAIGENNKLLRIRFGQTIDAANIQVQELTTVSSFLNIPRGIAKVVEGNQKYLLIANSGNGTVVRVSFGSTYTTVSPGRATISGLTGLAGLRGVSAYRQGSRLVAFVSGIGVGNSQIGVLDFPTGVTSAPVQSTINITGATGLNQVRVLNDCGEWLGLTSSFTQDKVYKLFFGTDLRTLESSQEVTGISGPLASELRIENGNHYGLVSTTPGNFWRLSFGSDFSDEGNTQLENLTTLGVLNNTTAFSIYERNSETVGLFIGFSDKKLSAVRFAESCGSSVLTSKELNPAGVRYSVAGNKIISLEGSDASGNIRRISHELNVEDTVAPQINFTIGSGNCANSAINFSSNIISGTVTDYQWIFDGVNGATTANTSFAFAAAGEHTVRLVVNNGNCTNTVEKEVTIYEEITPPVFTLVGSLCTNNQVAVSNTTDDASYPEGLVQYRWFLDGAQISTEKAPTITFPTSGAHQLRVTRSIPGCSAETTEDLLIDDGPVVTLDFYNSCWDHDLEEANVEFSTSVSGSNFAYSWDFGDNSSSSDPTPVHLYQTPGDYSVRVTVLDDNTGCSISTNPQIVSISDQPLADFEFSGAFSDLPISFSGIDKTSSGDEAVSWAWNFAGLGLANEQHPVFTFQEEGMFDVTLEVDTRKGCNESISKLIEVIDYPCPIVEFSTPESVCAGEELQIDNLSLNASRFEWDFCAGDIANEVSGKNLKTLSTLSGLRDIVLEYEEGVGLIGFVVAENNRLLRLLFGDSIDANNIQVEELTNVFPFLNFPRGMTKVIEDDQKYLLVGNANDGSIVKILFGESYLSKDLIISKIDGLTGLTGLRGLNAYWQNSHLIVFAGGTGTNNSLIEVLDFAQGIEGNAIQHTLVIPGAAGLNQVRVVNQCGTWYGVTSSFTQSRIFQLDFGNDLTSLETHTFFSGIANPLLVELSQDGNGVYGLVGTSPGPFWRVNFGENIMASNPQVENLTNFGILNITTGLALFERESKTVALVVGYNTRNLSELSFADKCNLEVPVSSELSPASIHYREPGTYQISLAAYGNSGVANYLTRTITVTDLAASPIDFSLDDSRCLGNTNQFNFIGDESVITSYSWDFDGDGVEDSNEPNPAWQFPAAGEYEVTLTVGNDNGCTNSAKKNIGIYEPPVPLFEWEEAEVMCSHNPIQFSDLTEGLPEDPEVVTYLWDFNGEATSDKKDPVYTFETPGEKTINLTISIPGCEGTASQSLSLLQGSAAGFSVPDQCLGGETQFINETSGEGITGYQWTFGEDYTSTQTSPSVFFEEAGDYDVSLTATNSLGCENTITEPVSMRALPVVDFSHDLACSGTAMQFTDKSTALLSNVVEWEWQFGSIGTSTEKNPQFAFPSAGTYDVTLTATSNYGCAATLTKQITVIEGAAADFTVAANCVGAPVVFKDISTSSVAITSRLWTINGKSYSTAEVTEVFTKAGEYNVTLQVTNSNLCSSTTTKTFEVFPLPAAEFQYSSNCTNELIEFVASENADTEVISRVWDFAGQAPANGARAYFQFEQPGDYPVSLEVLSAEGCLASVTKTVKVNQAPTAAFTYTSPYGQLPVTVDFSDASVGGSSRLWFVGDGAVPVSDAEGFSHTFEEEGSYLVTVVAFNDVGCTDTLSSLIGVAPPQLDLQLQSIHSIEENGVLSFFATLENRGTMNVSDFTILINVDDKITATELFSGTLQAGQTLAHKLDFELLTGSDGLSKVCMEIVTPLVDNETEFSPFDNSNCLSLSGSFEAGQPFPNPVEEHFTVELVLAVPGEVAVSLVGLSGQPVFSQIYPDLQAGLTTLRFEMEEYKPGVYLLRVRNGNVEVIQRLLKR